MRKSLLFALLGLLCAPALAQAANAQAEQYDELGMSLYRQGLYAKAADYFQNAVQADPTDWQGYENLGNAYFKTNDSPPPLSAYQKSLQLNPNNTTLENIVQSMQSNGATAATTAPAPSAPPSSPEASAGSVESEQPINAPAPPPQSAAPPQQPNNQQSSQTVVVERRHRGFTSYRINPEPIYTDGLNPIDHAKFWTKFELGYSYSTQGDLNNSATAINNENANGTLFGGLTNGNATFSSAGYNIGTELGFLLDPYNGLALGIRFIQNTNYVFNGINANAASIGSNPNDFENATFSPYVVPITLDYYLFLPDKNGRFFISVGGGYYVGIVNVAESYNFDNFNDSTGIIGSPAGDLTSGSFGFEASIGREFAISRNLGLEIFARGRYCKMSNFQGQLSDGNNYALVKYNDGTIDIDNPAVIGSGASSATIDFTGVDVGLSLNWYSL